MRQSFSVRFWGVRGTIPSPYPNRLRYGGNTSCVEVRCGALTLVLDAGTGLVHLGESRDDLAGAHLLLSHTHMDHIMGLPCTPQLFDPAFHAHIWAGHVPDEGIFAALRQLMSPPIFPIDLANAPATLHYHDVQAGAPLRHPDFTEHGVEVETFKLCHPDDATAYRIHYEGHSLCYVTDVEHCRDGLDAALAEFVAGTDVFIYDSTYDDARFEHHIGWGHSTWQQAIRLGQKAGVGMVVMFHHDPSATDAELDARFVKAQAEYTQAAMIAYEGLVLHPGALPEPHLPK